MALGLDFFCGFPYRKQNLTDFFRSRLGLHVGIMENNMETPIFSYGICWDFLGIMDKKMELQCRV